MNMKQMLLRISARDIQCVALIFVLAALLRLPHLEFPNVTQWDELIYTDNALLLLHSTPYVDTHPPLARILFAEAARSETPIGEEVIPLGENRPFGNFPYTSVRLLVAFAGILFTLAVYLVGRLMGHSPRLAMLPALFVAIDSALTLYSRSILADTILLLLGFLSLAAALWLVRTVPGRKRMLLILLSGIALGLALSVKWIALGMLLVISLLLLIRGHLRALVAVTGIAILVYVSVFTAYLLIYIPEGGQAKNVGMELAPGYVGNIEFPPFHSVTDALAFLPEYHKVMFATNNDPYVTASLQKVRGPLSWMISQPEIVFWSDPEHTDGVPSDQHIVVVGNFMIWMTGLCAWIFNLMWNIRESLRRRKFSIDRNELVLMIGYLANYMPFFFIHRQMFVYHYFTALIFLFLLVPYALPRVRLGIESVTRDRTFSYVFMGFICALVALNFFYNLPTTYGTQSWEHFLSQINSGTI